LKIGGVLRLLLQQPCNKRKWLRTSLSNKMERQDYINQIATNGTQEPASDDYRVKTILINHNYRANEQNTKFTWIFECSR
jgi:hypothetical protein